MLCSGFRASQLAGIAEGGARPMIARPLSRDQRGVAAVEFAITSPVVYFLALWWAQAGLWLFADFSLQRAADVASRWAAIQCGRKLTACPRPANFKATLHTSSAAFTPVDKGHRKAQRGHYQARSSFKWWREPTFAHGGN